MEKKARIFIHILLLLWISFSHCFNINTKIKPIKFKFKLIWTELNWTKSKDFLLKWKEVWRKKVWNSLQNDSFIHSFIHANKHDLSNFYSVCLCVSVCCTDIFYIWIFIQCLFAITKKKKLRIEVLAQTQSFFSVYQILSFATKKKTVKKSNNKKKEGKNNEKLYSCCCLWDSFSFLIKSKNKTKKIQMIAMDLLLNYRNFFLEKTFRSATTAILFITYFRFFFLDISNNCCNHIYNNKNFIFKIFYFTKKYHHHINHINNIINKQYITFMIYFPI